MRLEPFCVLDLAYTGEFHYVSPFADESGLGWGIGEGSATGERLARHRPVVEPSARDGPTG